MSEGDEREGERRDLGSQVSPAFRWNTTTRFEHEGSWVMRAGGDGGGGTL